MIKFLRFAFAALLICATTFAYGAPTFDSQGTADTLSSGNTNVVSASLTIASQPNRVLKAWLLGDNTSDVQGELSFTANGNAMSFVQKSVVSGQTVFEYELIAPPTGSVTVDGAWTTSFGYAFIVASFYDVHQSTPNRNLANAGNAGSANPSLGVTSAIGDLVVSVLSLNNDDSITDGAGQTRIASVLEGANGITGAVLNTKAGASGTVTSSWTTASQRWGAVATSLQAQHQELRHPQALHPSH